MIGWLEQESHQEISTVAGGLIALFGGGTGLAGGFVLSRGLSDSTGLIGSHLIAPACVPFVLGLFALHHIAVLTPPTWQNVAFYLYGTNAIATCATAVALLLRES